MTIKMAVHPVMMDQRENGPLVRLLFTKSLGAGDLPVWWVRLDRFGEWLAETRVQQNEQMWALQLQRGRDVAAQASAVAGLAAMQPSTFAVANALQACLQNTSTYCRHALPGRPGCQGFVVLFAEEQVDCS